jgi:hypothetical protein
VTAVNPLVAFYDIHGRKGEGLYLFCPGQHQRRYFYYIHYKIYIAPVMELVIIQNSLVYKIVQIWSRVVSGIEQKNVVKGD